MRLLQSLNGDSRQIQRARAIGLICGTVLFWSKGDTVELGKVLAHVASSFKDLFKLKPVIFLFLPSFLFSSCFFSFLVFFLCFCFCFVFVFFGLVWFGLVFFSFFSMRETEKQITRRDRKKQIKQPIKKKSHKPSIYFIKRLAKMLNEPLQIRKKTDIHRLCDSFRNQTDSSNLILEAVLFLFFFFQTTMIVFY